MIFYIFIFLLWLKRGVHLRFFPFRPYCTLVCGVAGLHTTFHIFGTLLFTVVYLAYLESNGNKELNRSGYHFLDHAQWHIQPPETCLPLRREKQQC